MSVFLVIFNSILSTLAIVGVIYVCWLALTKLNKWQKELEARALVSHTEKLKDYMRQLHRRNPTGTRSEITITHSDGRREHWTPEKEEAERLAMQRDPREPPSHA